MEYFLVAVLLLSTVGFVGWIVGLTRSRPAGRTPVTPYYSPYEVARYKLLYFTLQWVQWWSGAIQGLPTRVTGEIDSLLEATDMHELPDTLDAMQAYSTQMEILLLQVERTDWFLRLPENVRKMVNHCIEKYQLERM